ncbi:Uncharacterized protein TCM_019255 [Theobroma cacao]|uniref:Uncharacterized protein n=1 Tax=Theobroma cacao TaxID=3641 RepID=A0A061EHV7_THECC|nr:Uncharacterized protein TCM_019255 [Theobroma cacao]
MSTGRVFQEGYVSKNEVCHKNKDVMGCKANEAKIEQVVGTVVPKSNQTMDSSEGECPPIKHVRRRMPRRSIGRRMTKK